MNFELISVSGYTSMNIRINLTMLFYSKHSKVALKGL